MLCVYEIMLPNACINAFVLQQIESEQGDKQMGHSTSTLKKHFLHLLKKVWKAKNWNWKVWDEKLGWRERWGRELYNANSIAIESGDKRNRYVQREKKSVNVDHLSTTSFLFSSYCVHGWASYVLGMCDAIPGLKLRKLMSFWSILPFLLVFLCGDIGGGYWF